MIDGILIAVGSTLIFIAGYVFGKENGKEDGKRIEQTSHEDGSLRCEDDYLELGEEISERLPRCSEETEETEAIQVVEE